MAIYADYDRYVIRIPTNVFSATQQSTIKGLNLLVSTSWQIIRDLDIILLGMYIFCVMLLYPFATVKQ